MKKSRLLGAVYVSILSSISAPSHAALVDNGGGLIYDTVLDITWAQPDVPMPRAWDDANTWAAGLTLGGVSGWRLPYASVAARAGPLNSFPVDCNTATELACRDNELGYMFYHNLSGSSGLRILTSGDPDLTLFPSLQSKIYWTATEAPAPFVWYFSFIGGNQFNSNSAGNYYSWAVHSGNISAVPVPAAVILFCSGLIGLLGISRRKHAA